MNASFSLPVLKPQRGLVVLWFVLILALFGVRNIPWHLDNYDQAKQAYTSLEMVQDQHWWIQHSPKGPPALKPPLAGWVEYRDSISRATVGILAGGFRPFWLQ